MACENREKGNAAVKEGKHQDAIGRYTEAIMQLRTIENTTDVKWNDASRLQVIQLRAAAYLNLSLCFLKGQQWMHASNTATRALQGDKEPPDPKENVLEPDKKAKALFRRATAQCEFGNFDKAREDLKKAMEYAPEDQGVQQMLRKCDYAVKKVDKKADKKMSGFLKKAQDEGDGGLFDESLRHKDEPAKPKKPVEPMKLKDGLFLLPQDDSKPAPSSEEGETVDYDELAREIAVLKEEKPEEYKEMREKMQDLLSERITEEAGGEVEARVKQIAEHAFDGGEGDKAKAAEPAEPVKGEAANA